MPDSVDIRAAEGTNVPAGAGLIAWLCGGRKGLEGYLYLTHRITGIILLLFVIAHVLLSSSQLLGMEAWARLMEMATSPVVEYFRYPLLLAFGFHAFNGIRLILVELGLAVGRPKQQVYPYRGSIGRQRPLVIAMMILTAALLLVGEYDVLRLAH
ncbi:MAG: succinate dehydrogenase, cytochrome b556 subunit [Proteobacteria bacterium]|jgi:succinate dehydrogenase / fumarate reductase cytochrome b subunit|nr:succinate dehydrogenase, cytochrome b556 subunit [Pseudomonadota bacterium]